MNEKSLKVLFIELKGFSSGLDALFGEITGTSYILSRVNTSLQAKAVFDEDMFDIAIVGAPAEFLLDALQEIVEAARDVPIVVITSENDAECAISAISAGAQDVLFLEHLDPRIIERTIRYAIERQRMLTELRFALASEKVLMEELDRKNRELVELSITDGLTGLYNHRFLQERFDFEFKRAKRYKSPLCCFLLDIDHFKSVNDTFGHQFGDYVLAEIATLLRVNSRDVDICGRYGGEEFMVITTVGIDEATRYASKLHAAIDKHVFAHDDHKVHVTVSIGVAEYKGEIQKKQELIERSDTALYWAKRDGRNMIRLWKEQEGNEENTIDHFGIEGLKSEFLRLSNQMRATYIESTNALVKAIDARDHYTQEHLNHVAQYAVALATKLGLPEKEIEIIKYAGLLHDIGKIGIPQEILTKPSALTNEEFEILKKHPVIGANILKDVKFLEKEVPVILHHHEHWDGSGYPHGLKGREIPIGAQILSVVDSFDAMTTNRVYRKKMLLQDAIKEIEQGKDTQFSPEIADAFISLALQGGITVLGQAI